MLNKIVQMQFIKNFLNFSNDQKFIGKNIIYAINGAGKTNISRLIDCIANKKISLESLRSREANSMPSKFKLIINDIEVNESNYTSQNIENILVYNSDYIEDNIRTNSFSNKEIDGNLEIELGEEQKVLASLEIEKRSREDKVAAIKYV